jgi:TPR repeat protein
MLDIQIHLRTILMALSFGFILTPLFAVAESGDVESAAKLSQNETELQQLRSLATKGNTKAQVNLGILYEEGRGVPQDYNEAVKWYRLAAEADSADAQFSLGAVTYYGQGVPRDYQEAAKWFRLAADHGDAAAQGSLGLLYDNGQGVQQSYKEAAKWYLLAAEQGSRSARNNLGLLYEHGRGVPLNHIVSYCLYSLAATGRVVSESHAAENRTRLNGVMSKGELESAQLLIDEITNSGQLIRALEGYFKRHDLKE